MPGSVRSTASNDGGAATTLFIGKPTGATTGDLLKGELRWTGAVTMVTPNASWTPITTVVAGTGTGTVNLAVFYHVVVSGDSGTSTWSFVLSGNCIANCFGSTAIIGADLVTPIENFDVASGTGLTTISAPSVSTTVSNIMAFPTFASSLTAAWTGPAGYTAQVSDHGLASWDLIVSAAGSTGAAAAHNGTATYAAMMIAIRSSDSVGGGGGGGGEPAENDFAAIEIGREGVLFVPRELGRAGVRMEREHPDVIAFRRDERRRRHAFAERVRRAA